MNIEMLKAQLALAEMRLALYAWDESQHSRVPAGSSDGGQFESGSGATSPVTVSRGGVWGGEKPHGLVEDLIVRTRGNFSRIKEIIKGQDTAMLQKSIRALDAWHAKGPGFQDTVGNTPSIRSIIEQELAGRSK